MVRNLWHLARVWYNATGCFFALRFPSSPMTVWTPDKPLFELLLKYVGSLNKRSSLFSRTTAVNFSHTAVLYVEFPQRGSVTAMEYKYNS